MNPCFSLSLQHPINAKSSFLKLCEAKACYKGHGYQAAETGQNTDFYKWAVHDKRPFTFIMKKVRSCHHSRMSSKKWNLFFITIRPALRFSPIAQKLYELEERNGASNLDNDCTAINASNFTRNWSAECMRIESKLMRSTERFPAKPKVDWHEKNTNHKRRVQILMHFQPRSQDLSKSSDERNPIRQQTSNLELSQAHKHLRHQCKSQIYIKTSN